MGFPRGSWCAIVENRMLDWWLFNPVQHSFTYANLVDYKAERLYRFHLCNSLKQDLLKATVWRKSKQLWEYPLWSRKPAPQYVSYKLCEGKYNTVTPPSCNFLCILFCSIFYGFIWVTQHFQLAQIGRWREDCVQDIGVLILDRTDNKELN